MSLPSISPEHAARLIADGARIIDVRTPQEYAREHIPAACNVPLSQEMGDLGAAQGQVLIFSCRSGLRTRASAHTLLAAAGGCDAYILDGGIESWRRAGLSLTLDHRQPIDIMRQVQIAAGSLVLGGVVLGFWANPAFFGLSAFVGGGLVFSGVSGTCGMARLLGWMPWNNRRLPRN